MKTKHLKNMCNALCKYSKYWRFCDGDKVSAFQLQEHGIYAATHNWFDIIKSDVHSKNKRYQDMLMRMSRCINSTTLWDKLRYVCFPKYESLEELDMILKISGYCL